jgi:hypothetical protein
LRTVGGLGANKADPAEASPQIAFFDFWLRFG